MAYQRHVKLRTRKNQISATEQRKLDTYKVICESGDAPEVAVTGLGISLGSADGSYLAVDIDANEVEDSCGVFEVVVTYSTVWPVAGGPAGSVANPLARPVIKTADFVVSMVDVTEDADGNPIQNSAGDSIEGVQDERYDLVITYQRNVASFNWNLAADMIGALNAEEWNGYPARSARVTKFSAQEQWENNVSYSAVTLEITIRNDANGVNWGHNLRDQGFYDGSGNRDYDANGDPKVEMTDLDGNGDFLVAGSPVFLLTHTIKTRNFGALAPYTT